MAAHGAARRQTNPATSAPVARRSQARGCGRPAPEGAKSRL